LLALRSHISRLTCLTSGIGPEQPILLVWLGGTANSFHTSGTSTLVPTLQTIHKRNHFSAKILLEDLADEGCVEAVPVADAYPAVDACIVAITIAAILTPPVRTVRVGCGIGNLVFLPFPPPNHPPPLPGTPLDGPTISPLPPPPHPNPVPPPLPPPMFSVPPILIPPKGGIIGSPVGLPPVEAVPMTNIPLLFEVLPGPVMLQSGGGIIVVCDGISERDPPLIKSMLGPPSWRDNTRDMCCVVGVLEA